MHSFYLFSALACFIATISAQSDVGVPGPWGPNDPTITVVNAAKDPQTYDVAVSAGVPATAFKGCTACIKVPAGATVKFHAGVGFNGAITNSKGGTRHEINCGDPAVTWYDDDMEYGMSDATLGPSDNKPTTDGRPSLLGEQDVLAKANAGWKTINNDAATQKTLLATGYLTGTVGGPLTKVKMDIHAPLPVIAFYQLTAQFNAYIGHGSVANLPPDITTAAADKQTHVVATHQMTITEYS